MSFPIDGHPNEQADTDINMLLGFPSKGQRVLFMFSLGCLFLDLSMVWLTWAVTVVGFTYHQIFIAMHEYFPDCYFSAYPPCLKK